MANYSVQSEGNHIVPYTLQVTDSINITTVISSRVGTANPFGEAAFNNQMQTAATNIENNWKTLPEFSVQDESRNCTWECINPEQLEPESEFFFYDFNVSFTIQNATLQLTVPVQTDLTGSEKDAYLQSVADTAVSNFKAQNMWIDL